MFSKVDQKKHRTSLLRFLSKVAHCFFFLPGFELWGLSIHYTKNYFIEKIYELSYESQKSVTCTVCIKSPHTFKVPLPSPTVFDYPRVFAKNIPGQVVFPSIDDVPTIYFILVSFCFWCCRQKLLEGYYLIKFASSLIY